MTKNGYLAAVAVLCGFIAQAETYTHNGTSDSQGKTAFTRLESWNNSAGVKASTTGATAAEVFNVTNDFVTVNKIRAWDNHTSNRFACASLTLGDDTTRASVLWKTYSPGYAVVDNCLWRNARLYVNNDRVHVIDGKWTVLGSGTTRHLFSDEAATSTQADFKMRVELHGASDVEVTMAGKEGVSVPNTIYLDGDFSDYAGRFSLSEFARVALGSASSTGNAAVEKADAIYLANGGGLMVKDGIGEQLPLTRGVTLDSGTNYVYATSGYNGLLRMPITGAGLLEKRGSGTATLAGSYSAGDVIVAEGTLCLAEGATFAAEAPRFAVRADATLVISNVALAARSTYERAEGATILVVADTVPYDADAKTATPLDFTSLTAEQWANVPKPLMLGLSAPMTFPINETNRLVVARFAAGTTVNAADFTNLTAKTYGLPYTWFEAGTDSESGTPTLVYVSKPVVTRVNSNRLVPMTAQNDSKGNAIWSDGLGAHAGADYLQTRTGEIKTWDGYDKNIRTFPGDSLYMTAGKFALKSTGTRIRNLTLDSDDIEFTVFGPGVGTAANILGGPITIPEGRTVSMSVNNGYSHWFNVNAEIRGGGALSLASSSGNRETNLFGTNSLFTGTVKITTDKTIGTLSTNGLTVVISDPSSLGGPLPTFKYDAVSLYYSSFIRPLTSMTLNQLNRGITFMTGYSGFDVPEGVELTVGGVVRNNVNGIGALLKDGAGVLKMNNSMRFGYAGTNLLWNINNRIFVRNGWLRASDNPANGYQKNCVYFTSGTGIAVDQQNVGEYGLYLPGSDAIAVTNFSGETASDAKIDVRLDNAESVLAAGAPFTVPICTVTNTTADLTGVFNVRKPGSGWAGCVVATPLADEGLVRYDAAYSRTGLILLFR